MPLAIPLDSCTPDEFNAAFDIWLTEQRPLEKYDPLPPIEWIGDGIDWTPEIARRVQSVIERAAAMPALSGPQSVEINRLAALGRTQPFRNPARVRFERDVAFERAR